MPLGLLIGKIKCYIKLNELGLCIISNTDIKSLESLKLEISSYKNQLNDGIISDFNDRLLTISKEIIN